MDNKNDILALAMYNPQASVADLLANGITAENTTIHPEQDYLKYEDVVLTDLYYKRKTASEKEKAKKQF